MASAILGDWTHRRGDPGGARAVVADIEKPRPAIAWSWRPEHGGRVDQVRVAGPRVIVATMMPDDPGAPGWEHAVIYALDAETGAEVCRRPLPDPAPVAAMVIGAGDLHIVAAGRAEPIFWYALSLADLAPRHRRVATTPGTVPYDDVLDAWVSPEGGLWLELELSSGGDSPRAQAYAFAGPAGTPPAVRMKGERPAARGPPLARDACAAGRELFVPIEGRWAEGADASPPALSRLDPWTEGPSVPTVFATAHLVGPRAQIHALAGEGAVCAIAAADDPAKPDRVRVEAFAVQETSGAVLWRAQDDRLEMGGPWGKAARLARRPNGELLFQSLGRDGTPRTPLVCVRPDGHMVTLLLGARGPYILDAALGDLVLAHRERREGRVEVSGFAIDLEGRLLGRRATARWTIDTADLGGGATVYAAAGLIFVRGARAVCAVRI
jgi:hypothetical protein